jgi:hypothetical protein
LHILTRLLKRRVLMQHLTLRHLSFAALLFLLLTTVRYTSAATPPENDGTIVVLVTWGDIGNTPANDVYVEAHGYVEKDKAEKSFVFTMARAGRYEVTIPPGVYDVFVSEGNSEPRCKRVLVVSGRTGYWTLKLETDAVFTQK